MNSFAEPTHLDPPSLGWDEAAEQHRYDDADLRNAAEAADAYLESLSAPARGAPNDCLEPSGSGIAKQAATARVADSAERRGAGPESRDPQESCPAPEEGNRKSLAGDAGSTSSAQLIADRRACETEARGVTAGGSFPLAVTPRVEVFTRDVLYTQAELDALDFARRADLPAHVRILLDSLWLALSLRARNGRA